MKRMCLQFCVLMKSRKLTHQCSISFCFVQAVAHAINFIAELKRKMKWKEKTEKFREREKEKKTYIKLLQR